MNKSKQVDKKCFNHEPNSIPKYRSMNKYYIRQPTEYTAQWILIRTKGSNE